MFLTNTIPLWIVGGVPPFYFLKKILKLNKQERIKGNNLERSKKGEKRETLWNLPSPPFVSAKKFPEGGKLENLPPRPIQNGKQET